MILLTLYNLVILAFLPFLVIYYIIRIFLGKETLRSFFQKVPIFLLFSRAKHYDIWFHAASVGEVKSLEFLIKTQKKILITTTTLKSAEVIPNGASHRFLPLDFLPFLLIFILKNRVKRVIVAESEIWPNLFVILRIFRKKMTLFNARFSKFSQKKWNLAPNFLRFLLKSCSQITAQSLGTQQFLQKFHSDVKYFGNLKILNLQNQFEKDKIIENFCQNSKILCVASTHEGEDESIIKQILNLQNQFKILYIPRHPHRSAEISQILLQNGVKNSLHSAGICVEKCLVVDKIGIMQTAFFYSDTVIFGGSFLPHLKGHNILEAGFFGCNIITGNFVETFQEIIDEMVLCKAILQCDVNEISQKIIEAQEFKIGKNAKNFVEKNTPEKQKILEFLQL